MARVPTLVLILLISKGLLCAQSSGVSELTPRPVFRVDVVERVAQAINYGRLSGGTRIDFRGTPLMPLARGEARVNPKRGFIEIDVDFRNMDPATDFGSEYLTYVLWAITPEGRAANLGEALVRRKRSQLNVTVELQVFALIVTAEPYFAVRQPSNLVVMENGVPGNSDGPIEVADARFQLLQRGQYQRLANPLMLTVDSDVPLGLYEARNAVQIARSSGAAEYAADTFLKAEFSLRQAEAYQARDEGERLVTMLAREAVQRAEDAREIAVRRQEEEELEQERQAAAERERLAREAAAEEARRREEAERQAAAEQVAREHAEQLAAEKEQLEAELRQAKAEARDASEKIQQTLELLDQRTVEFQDQRERWELERQRREEEEAQRRQRLAELDRVEARLRLENQLNQVLRTTDSEEGVVVEVTGDLFSADLAELSPEGREQLALTAGILLAYQGLAYEVRGTELSDSSLTAERMETIRRYLNERGLSESDYAESPLSEKPPSTAAAGEAVPPIRIVVRGETIGFPAEAVLHQTSPF